MMIVLERHCGSELELLSRARDLRMKIYQCTRQYPLLIVSPLMTMMEMMIEMIIVKIYMCIVMIHAGTNRTYNVGPTYLD